MKPISHQLLSWSIRHPHFGQGSAHSEEHWCNFTLAPSFWWPPRPTWSSVPSDRQNWAPTGYITFPNIIYQIKIIAYTARFFYLCPGQRRRHGNYRGTQAFHVTDLPCPVKRLSTRNARYTTGSAKKMYTHF